MQQKTKIFSAFKVKKKIIFKTILKVLKRDDINTDGMDTAEDLCDYLLRTNKITEKEYKEKLKIH